MGFEKLDPDEWLKSLSRVLITGPPNTRKTTSLATWPRPIHIISYPGEKGASSIPVEEEGINAYVYKEDDISKSSPGAIVKEIEKMTIEILTGAHGPIATFAGDGLHKLYELYYQREHRALIEAYPGDDEDKLAGRAYGNAHKEFLLYLTKTSYAKIDNAVFTVWDGLDRDDPEAKRGPTHIYPDLPGKMARRIVGEFSVVLFAKLGLPQPDSSKQRASWQIQPVGKIHGCGVKIPAHIAAKLPKEVPFQDWKRLLPVLKGEVTLGPTGEPLKTAPGLQRPPLAGKVPTAFQPATSSVPK